MGDDAWPLILERALRFALRAHEGQFRKGTAGAVPYASHVVAVAFLLRRIGFEDEVVAAGLLHDVVEDASVTIEKVGSDFGGRVAELVSACTERKRDEAGRPRSWVERKREALDCLASASVEARGVALADKLHNLLCIEMDLREGRPVWAAFNAGRSDVLAYYREAVERWGGADERLAGLAAACAGVLERIEAID